MKGTRFSLKKKKHIEITDTFYVCFFCHFKIFFLFQFGDHNTKTFGIQDPFFITPSLFLFCCYFGSSLVLHLKLEEQWELELILIFKKRMNEKHAKSQKKGFQKFLSWSALQFWSFLLRKKGLKGNSLSHKKKVLRTMLPLIFF